MIRRFLLVAAGTVVLTILQVALAFLAPAADAPGASGFLLVLASNALISGLLIEIGLRLPGSPWRRALVLWAVWGGIQANSLAETLLFDIGIPRADTPWLWTYSLAVSAAFSAFAGWAARPGDVSTASTSEVTVAPRMLLLSPLIYIVLYMAAGMLVWPYVEEFYRTRPMPPLQAVLSLQIVRGLAFGAIVWLLARTLRTARGEVVLFAGLTLGVLGGVAPLIVPNPYLPLNIRLAHLPETALSNFAFGAIVAWMLTARTTARRTTTPVGGVEARS